MGLPDPIPPGEPTPSLTTAELERTEAILAAALAHGIARLDTADIYGAGRSEAALGQVLAARPEWAGRLQVQTKFGIVPGGPGAVSHYRQDGDYVLACVEASLARLHRDYLDVLLIHRPDPLADYFSTGRALMHLMEEGTVRRIGVSNMGADQISLWRRVVPVAVNQVELSLAAPAFIDCDVDAPAPAGFSASLLPFCMAEGIEVQAYSPLARGALERRDHPVAPVAARIARHRGLAPSAVLLAWLLAHPAGIRPVVGTTRPERLAEYADAAELSLTREEWYALYTAARGRPLP